MRIPGAVRNLIGNPHYDWNYSSEPDASRLARPISWSAGRVVGGGSAINGMVFNRGLARDYDQWAALGCSGWSARDVEPVFMKLENFPAAEGPTRGRTGPVDVEFNRYRSPVVQPWLNACAQIGVPQLTDINAFAPLGVGCAQSSTRRGRRCSSRDAYLSRPRPNLRLRSAARATALCFDGSRCTGVSYQCDGQRLNAYARREVILCAGTFGSPQLLMLAGIGDPAMLQPFGVMLRRALPGVGKNLQDHAGVGISLAVHANTITAGDDRLWRKALHGLRWWLRGDGMAAGATVLACGYALSALGRVEPDTYLQLLGFGLQATLDHALRFSDTTALTTICSVAQPRTRGKLCLASLDAYTPLRGELQLLGDESDCARLVTAMRLVRRIHAAPALGRIAREELLPGRDVQSDEQLLAFARSHAGSQYHAVGTCAMGVDASAVVDPQLRVHGLQGLRVADASIMPRLTSANTNAPVIMIAERAAELLRATSDCQLPGR